MTASLTSDIRLMMGGHREAGNRVVELLHQELRARACGCLRGDPSAKTLQVTDLVSEAYLKVCTAELEFQNRDHFLASIAKAMRWVVVDHAKRRASLKRGGGEVHEQLDNLVVQYESRAIDILALNEALEKLEEFDPVMARAIELRFFGGMEFDAIADELNVARRTLGRKWKMTLAWLSGEVG